MFRNNMHVALVIFPDKETICYQHNYGCGLCVCISAPYSKQISIQFTNKLQMLAFSPAFPFLRLNMFPCKNLDFYRGRENVCEACIDIVGPLRLIISINSILINVHIA